MIGYVTLGVNDFEAAKTFYDKALAGLGAQRGFSNERMQGFRVKGMPAQLMVCKPYDGGRASVGNGSMVSLIAPSREAVDRVHKDALAAGAKDEGAPGDRGAGFYGAYFRDPDGNKICVFKMGE
jgi:catechol 2,3-dioxygenase-like lactoylglutathione lyase family enzyme